MPKITLRNKDSGKLEDFEPVDAREALAVENTIYEVPQGTSEQIGQRLDPNNLEGVQIAQLQGADAEMQTGLSIDKYQRQAVVKAQVGDPATTREPMTTTGVPIAAALSDAQTSDMTVPQLRDELDRRGVAIPDGARKADLVALLQANAR